MQPRLRGGTSVTAIELTTEQLAWKAALDPATLATCQRRNMWMPLAHISGQVLPGTRAYARTAWKGRNRQAWVWHACANSWQPDSHKATDERSNAFQQHNCCAGRLPCQHCKQQQLCRSCARHIQQPDGLRFCFRCWPAALLCAQLFNPARPEQAAGAALQPSQNVQRHGDGEDQQRPDVEDDALAGAVGDWGRQRGGAERHPACRWAGMQAAQVGSHSMATLPPTR